MGYQDYKRNRHAELEQINAKLKEQTTASYEKDARYWQPVVDKAGNGLAVIRFLPAPDGEDLPFVRLFTHSFKGPGGWYIEKSLTTLGGKDPVGEANSKLWATEIDANREIARRRKRRLGFISNIEVLKHSARPEDEGKVFLFNYGKKIFDKINDKMNPAEELGVDGWNPFDLFDGANFILKIKKVGEFRNYDDSSFADRAPHHGGDDAKLEAVFAKLHSLQAEIAPGQFKSYDELEKKFLRVIGENTDGAGRGRERAEQRAERTERVEATKAEARDEVPFDADEAEDDPSAFFKKLAAR